MEKLIYLTHTKPDLAYAARVVNQFMHYLREWHLKAVKRVLWYLKANSGKWFLFKRDLSPTMEAYIDADYIGLMSDIRSISNY